MKRLLIMFATCYLAVATYGQEVIDYGIIINNIAITSENADSVTGSGISGLIKYDAASNTLTLRDASFGNISSSRTDLLNIHLLGNNRAWSIGCPAISCQGDLHVTGPGHLQVINYDDFGDYSCIEIDGSLTISDNSFIEAYLIKIYNFISQPDIFIGWGKTLTVDSSILQTTSIHADNIELIGCKQVCDNPIIFCPENDDAQFYGLWVGEMPITTYNADNIVNPYILSGKASYDYLTNTLSLDNIKMNDPYLSYKPIIESDNDNLNLMLSGNNNLWGELKGKELHLTGKGFISIYCIEANPMQMSDLVLEDGCEFVTGIGAQGSDIHINSLTVNNSTFRCEIVWGDLYVNELNLINAEIENNPNVMYDAEAGKFYSIDYGAELVIKPTCNTAIRDISGDNPNTEVLFDLQGRRVAEPTQPGIYIRDGKKVIVN